MRKPKMYYPAFLGLKISTELDQALWTECDSLELDRSRLVRDILERVILKKENVNLGLYSAETNEVQQ